MPHRQQILDVTRFFPSFTEKNWLQKKNSFVSNEQTPAMTGALIYLKGSIHLLIALLVFVNFLKKLH